VGARRTVLPRGCALPDLLAGGRQRLHGEFDRLTPDGFIDGIHRGTAPLRPGGAALATVLVVATHNVESTVQLPVHRRLIEERWLRFRARIGLGRLRQRGRGRSGVRRNEMAGCQRRGPCPCQPRRTSRAARGGRRLGAWFRILHGIDLLTSTQDRTKAVPNVRPRTFSLGETRWPKTNQSAVQIVHRDGRTSGLQAGHSRRPSKTTSPSLVGVDGSGSLRAYDRARLGADRLLDALGGQLGEPRCWSVRPSTPREGTRPTGDDAIICLLVGRVP